MKILAKNNEEGKEQILDEELKSKKKTEKKMDKMDLLLKLFFYKIKN